MQKLAFLVLTLLSTSLSAADQEMTVYRSPTCTCCGRWIEHVKANGFKVKDIISDDMDAIKEKNGIPEKLASCHTAVVNGYVVEGHVPADDIHKLLSSKSKLAGIAAPGMPLASPGMETPGHTADPYQVISFDQNNQFAVFASH